ncbi:uncharacterized protein N0V89_012269 [Didymosphaeria variabile]|uniref:Xylanolytic transcriptional activator regulatory domain-containing protein n=1 Tax=Didymosphaeria variabile TaxID=1932322 RepID=A0A9W8X989_9PLEO|nr:uncharacterized protein N0V89_012269 [Didymosphaeria variabile]KAJ4344526.1 hypothetical protein N0V89_012269 [Didymosphaeria variabile]
MPKEESLPMRKKMRKGTHSCFEYNPDVCSECFARGSRCIDQENADPEVVVDHRKNLRERVSRLEALVDSLLEEKTERSTSDSVSVSRSVSMSKTPNVVTKDTFPPTPLSSEAASSISVLKDAQRAPSDRGHHVPILSIFEDALNDAEERIKARMEPLRKDSNPNSASSGRYTLSYTNPDDVMENDNSFGQQAKKERTKQALLAMLPSYEKLNKILTSNSEWWQTWRRKCSGTSASDETLPQFASKALASGNIGAMGTVVLAVGICSDDEREVERYIEMVDRWVLGDDEFAATLEGMECLILKAKWYADVGQPRRAWLAYRKGLMYTQLMVRVMISADPYAVHVDGADMVQGLHRKRTSSSAHESIWWALYHGDRFLSLLLGLPYGISDSHCDLTLPDIPNGPYMAPLTFMNKMSILSGKVIDRNQGIAEQSFAWALQLDQELEDLYKKLDPEWLEYSELLADIESNAAELRERIMAQMVYHQIRVYLHLPFMLKSAVNSRFTYSRTACVNGSREVLKLYQALRTGEVQPLYECKAVDFIGFTSAVLIVLGLFNYGATNTPISPAAREADVRLIEMSIDIFRRASSEKGGKVALQSAQVLEKMLKKLKTEIGQPVSNSNPNDLDDCSAMSEFVIPYFGTLHIRRGGHPVSPCALEKHDKQWRMDARTMSPLDTTGKKTNAQFTPRSDLASSASDFFSQSTTSNPGLTTPSTTNTSTASPNQASGFTEPFISYDGFYNWGNALDTQSQAGTATGTQINDDSLNNFPLPTNNFSWQNMPMDIDQDWSWFLNDGGNGSSTNTNTAANPDLFAQQGFVGFG